MGYLLLLPAGRFPGSRPHRYDNEGDQPARLTMVVVIPPSPG